MVRSFWAVFGFTHLAVINSCFSAGLVNTELSESLITSWVVMWFLDYSWLFKDLKGLTWCLT